jgi:hypothetical protein
MSALTVNFALAGSYGKQESSDSTGAKNAFSRHSESSWPAWRSASVGCLVPQRFKLHGRLIDRRLSPTQNHPAQIRSAPFCSNTKP